MNAKTSTTIEYGKDREQSADVDVKITAKHRGPVSVVSHPRHYVFPKNDQWSRTLEHSLGNGDGAVSQVKTHSHAYEVIPSGREN